MGIKAVVFEPQSFQSAEDLMARFRDQRKAEKKRNWQSPESSSTILQIWFSEMCQSYPRLVDADPEDLNGTEYCFYHHFIDMVFAGPVAERAVIEAWKLAHERSLRIVVGGKLLPTAASDDRTDVQIPALDGRRRQSAPSESSIAIIAIVDPAFAPASGTKEWVRQALNLRESHLDDTTAVSSARFKQWHDEFIAIVNDRAQARCKILEGMVVVSVKPSHLSSVAQAAIDLSTRLGLVMLFLEHPD